jgi:hypothetical protein
MRQAENADPSNLHTLQRKPALARKWPPPAAPYWSPEAADSMWRFTAWYDSEEKGKNPDQLVELAEMITAVASGRHAEAQKTKPTNQDP